MFYCYDYVNISELVGKTLTAIETDDYEFILFKCEDGSEYKMFHSQDCCESVTIEDIIGEFDDLIGNPILIAEERYGEPPERVPDENGYVYTPESETWTFYELATVKGSVTIRWYGTSNGYYSEEVNFAKVA